MAINLTKNLKKTKKDYPGLTKYVMGTQIAGSKVFLSLSGL